MRGAGCWVGLTLAGVAACSDGRSAVSSSAAQPICPNCQHAGTETTDFSGSAPPCSGDPAPVPDAAWSARLQEVQDVYAGGFEATLGWRESSQSPPLQAAPSGYERATRVSGSITLGDAQFLEGRPTLAAAPDYECPDQFLIPATIELVTADGAFAGTAVGELNVGGGASRLRARLDLADAAGTLDLHLDPGLEYQAAIELTLDFYPGAKHGQLELWFGMGEQGPDVFNGYRVLEAYFPDDGCGVNGLRSSTDVPVPWLEGQTTAQVLASWQTAIGDTAIQGSRIDCASGTPEASVEVDLSFELGAPDRDAVCQRPAWAAAETEGRVRFASPGHLRTSDGLIDAALASGNLTSQGLSLQGVPWPAFPLSAPFGSIAAEQFAAQTGISGIDPGRNTQLLPLIVADFSRRDGNVAAQGSVIVIGYPCTSGPECMGHDVSVTSWPLNDSRRCSIP